MKTYMKLLKSESAEDQLIGIEILLRELKNDPNIIFEEEFDYKFQKSIENKTRLDGVYKLTKLKDTYLLLGIETISRLDKKRDPTDELLLQYDVLGEI